jgi:hypothetical protein
MQKMRAEIDGNGGKRLDCGELKVKTINAKDAKDAI